MPKRKTPPNKRAKRTASTSAKPRACQALPFFGGGIVDPTLLHVTHPATKERSMGALVEVGKVGTQTVVPLPDWIARELTWNPGTKVVLQLHRYGVSILLLETQRSALSA